MKTRYTTGIWYDGVGGGTTQSGDDMITLLTVQSMRTLIII